MTREELDLFCDLYDRIKREIKQKEPQFYERWKAGGFLIDGDVVSTYPIITEILDELEDEEDSSHGMMVSELTQNQLNCLEENISRHIRGIPSDFELDGCDYLSGLEIEQLDCTGENEYSLWYSWEDCDDKIQKRFLKFTAVFLDDVVEDINFV